MMGLRGSVMSHWKAGGSRLQLAEGSTARSCSNGLKGRPRLKLTAEDATRQQNSSTHVCYAVGTGLWKGWNVEKSLC
jgi:hypothetical protein